MAKAKKDIRRFVLAAIFAAIIVVMTVVPYTGYINYGGIEITTLHIVVILGAVFLGPAYGAFLGGVWGVTCLLRAFTNPLWVMFTNPMISVVPRILVGLVAGLVFRWLLKTKLNTAVSAGITSVVSTLVNTVLVLSFMNIFGGLIESYQAFFEMFKSIFMTLITVNCVIELCAALVVVPLLWRVLQRYYGEY